MPLKSLHILNLVANSLARKTLKNTMKVLLSSVVCILAHEDSIWSCSWGRSDKDGTENIVTGSVDDTVKVWKW